LDLTLRQIITRDPGRVRYHDLSDEGTIIDMDTMEDYLKVLEKSESMPQPPLNRNTGTGTAPRRTGAERSD
jgi:hypothetical protein